MNNDFLTQLQSDDFASSMMTEQDQRDYERWMDQQDGIDMQSDDYLTDTVDLIVAEHDDDIEFLGSPDFESGWYFEETTETPTGKHFDAADDTDQAEIVKAETKRWKIKVPKINRRKAIAERIKLEKETREKNIETYKVLDQRLGRIFKPEIDERVDDANVAGFAQMIGLEI